MLLSRLSPTPPSSLPTPPSRPTPRPHWMQRRARRSAPSTRMPACQRVRSAAWSHRWWTSRCRRVRSTTWRTRTRALCLESRSLQPTRPTDRGGTRPMEAPTGTRWALSATPRLVYSRPTRTRGSLSSPTPTTTARCRAPSPSTPGIRPAARPALLATSRSRTTCATTLVRWPTTTTTVRRTGALIGSRTTQSETARQAAKSESPAGHYKSLPTTFRTSPERRTSAGSRRPRSRLATTTRSARATWCRFRPRATAA